MNKTKKKWFNNKELLINLGSILLIVSLLIGTSYSAFIWSEESNKQQTLVAGTLQVELDDTSPTLGGIISLNNGYPMSDEDGSNLETNAPYKFKIKNTGNVPVSYTIKLENDETIIETDLCSENLLDDNNVKIKLTGDYISEVKLLDTLANNVLISGSLEGQSEKTVNLSLWIKEDASNNIIGKHFHKKLVLDSSQILALNYENSKEELVGNGIGESLLGYRIYGNSTTSNRVTTSLGENGSFDIVSSKKNLLKPPTGPYPLTSSSLSLNYDGTTYTLNGNAPNGYIFYSYDSIEIKKGESLYLTLKLLEGSVEDLNAVVFYTKKTDGTSSSFYSDSWMNGIGPLEKSKSITFTEDVTINSWSFWGSNSDEISTFENAKIQVQLEKGTIDTSYEPYQTLTTTISLDEPLRSVGNIRDYIEYPSGKLVRKVGVNENGELYKLSEQVIEEITLPEIPTFNGTTILKINGGTISARYY